MQKAITRIKDELLVMEANLNCKLIYFPQTARTPGFENPGVLARSLSLVPRH
jgi:hypothetical protein